MLKVTDARQTRVFQEGREEELEVGREEGLEIATEAIALRLLDLGRPIAEIAKVTQLPPAKIRKLKKDREGR